MSYVEYVLAQALALRKRTEGGIGGQFSAPKETEATQAEREESNLPQGERPIEAGGGALTRSAAAETAFSTRRERTAETAVFADAPTARQGTESGIPAVVPRYEIPQFSAEAADGGKLPFEAASRSADLAERGAESFSRALERDARRYDALFRI